MDTNTLFSSENDKWLTPSWLCDKVGKFLGGDFLDPAAPEIAPTYTGANRWFTEKEDGLIQDWKGKVYLNPPYGRGIGEWTQKFTTEYFGGHMHEGLLLVPARTDTQWWAELVRHSPSILFLYGRLKFDDADNSAPFPSALFYLGQRRMYFVEQFKGIGWFARVVGT